MPPPRSPDQQSKRKLFLIPASVIQSAAIPPGDTVRRSNRRRRPLSRRRYPGQCWNISGLKLDRFLSFSASGLWGWHFLSVFDIHLLFISGDFPWFPHIMGQFTTISYKIPRVGRVRSTKVFCSFCSQFRFGEGQADFRSGIWGVISKRRPLSRRGRNVKRPRWCRQHQTKLDRILNLCGKSHWFQEH